MAANLNDTQLLAEAVEKRIEQLLIERDNLRRELARKSSGSIEHDKAFIQAYQNGIIDNELSAVKTAKLEHMLMIR